MEKLKIKNLSLPSHIFTRFAAALIVIVGLGACGNKDGGGTAAVATVVGLEGCANCGALGTPSLIASFNSESMYMSQWPVQMVNMRMYGSSTTYANSTYGAYPNTYGTNYGAYGSAGGYNLYSGNISIQGTLVIQQQIMSASRTCVVPPGSYAIQTYSMGNITNGNNLQVPDMIAGGMRLRMIGASYVNGSMLVNENGSIRWKGTLEIVSVNGVNCNGAFYSYMK